MGYMSSGFTLIFHRESITPQADNTYYENVSKTILEISNRFFFEQTAFKIYSTLSRNALF